MKNALLALLVCVGAYQMYNYWKLHRAVRDYVASHPVEAGNRPASASGFTDTLTPDGLDPSVMTVFMPENCPMEAGVRGRALVERMKEANIPLAVSDHASMQVRANTKAEFDAKMELARKGTAVMGGEPPIVFYKGRAKANPSIEEVILEYQAGR
jgi:hypothetical protein